MTEDTKTLSLEEKERTKRQKLIEGWEQEALKKGTVFIAGVGALGCEIAKDFALMGVGKLILCDLDKIETSNLSRQMLFYKGDEGRYKAEVAAERLKLMNPFMEIETYTIKLQKIPMDKYKECDVIIAALDNVQARMDLNKFCIKLGKPMVEGGTVGFEGHVQVIIPQSTRTEDGNRFPFGNKEAVINSVRDEMLWSLNEEKYADYFKAQEEIWELEQKIEEIKDAHVNPVLEEVREEAKQKVEENEEKYLYHTPCYRCVVPAPPPPEKQVAACTLKGIPRTREHCAFRGEVLFIKKHDRKPDLDNPEDIRELYDYILEELKGLRERVLDESIPPEQKEKITEEELKDVKQNIYNTFPDYELIDIENVLGQKIPAVQSVSSIISSIESQEALKLMFLMKGRKVGPVMDPPYINYNGVYGQFDQVPVSRRDDCVACGKRKGQENLQVALPLEATVENLFETLKDMGTPINLDNWMITNPLTKKFIYNPMFEAGKTEDRKLTDMDVGNMEELTFTVFGDQKKELEVHQYNVLVNFL